MNYKTMVMVLFAVFIIVGTTSGIYLSQRYEYVSGANFKSALPVELTQVKSVSTNPTRLVANLKGSIYESGESVTVFGACTDGYGYLLPDANATFSSWYPNGTQWHVDQLMTAVLEGGNVSGRFSIQMNMSDAMGTYLTQIRCMYGGDYALAFGEWQNPDWVKRIKDTQLAVESLTNLSIAQYDNITLQIQNFGDVVQINFSQVLNAISGLNLTGDFGDMGVQLKEIYNQVHALDTSFWVIDANAPWYSFGGNTFNFRAVDMLSPGDIYAVSNDGYVVYWDGETWQIKANYSDIAWYGVSVLPASMPYAWFVGQNTSSNTSVYSVDGGTPATLNGTTGTAYLDIKLFPNPNSPSSNFFAYVLENSGDLWYSSDNGVLFGSVATMDNSCGPVEGRLSQVIYNTDLGVTSGYRMAGVMCDEFWYYNGTGWSSLAEANQIFADVEIVYNDLAYAVSKDSVTDELKVWKFDGDSLSLVYVANDTTIDPRGIAAAATNDVWIVTNNPAVYYHYDGFKWEYANYPYSGAIGLAILFNFGNMTNATMPGLYDISMFNSKNAYAVGTDGIIMKFYSIFDEKFDTVINTMSNLTAIYGLLASMNVTMANISGTMVDMQTTINTMNLTLNNLYNIVADMNLTFTGLFENLSDKIDQLNLTMNVRFDEVIANMTYMQLYLNTTIYPMLSLILERLGVIETNVNATLQIVNESQQTINAMNANVNELLNRTPKIRAWITQ
jgi:hypothetical protein